MATNPYFNNYNARNEQNLIEGMVIESIKIKGLDVVYIQRIQDDIDYLFKEDPSNIFKEGCKIEMYPAFVSGFDGDGELFTNFGIQNIKTGTFLVSKKRFCQLFPDFIRPREGDILFMPITNAFLEIKYVNDESPFFEKGKQYVWELKVETATYSHEKYEIFDDKAADALSGMEIEAMLTPEGEYTPSDDDPGADNVNIRNDADGKIIVNPNNPFGVK